MVGQTNQLSQTAATPLLSNHRSGNQVQKGIKGDYLGHPGFFHYREMEESSRGCAVWLPSVAGSGAALCLGKEERRIGPKTDMLSSAWMPSNHSSSLPLCRVFPPPLAGPSLQSELRAYNTQRLLNTQDTSTSHTIDVKCFRPCPLPAVLTQKGEVLSSDNEHEKHLIFSLWHFYGRLHL